MATTWNSLAFGIQTSDSVPLPEQQLITSIRPIPYSDASVLDISGLTETHFKATIIILPAALASWRATLGTEHALVVDSATYSTTAVLIALNNIRRTPHNDRILADVEFVW